MHTARRCRRRSSQPIPPALAVAAIDLRLQILQPLLQVGGAAVDLVPEAAAWRTSKGTLQFTADNPIPAKIIKKIVKARAAQIRG